MNFFFWYTVFMDVMTFAARLKEFRRSLGMLGRELADELGVTHASYRNWEAGRNLPRPNVMTKLRELGFGSAIPATNGTSDQYVPDIDRPVIIDILLQVMTDDRFTKHQREVARKAVSYMVKNPPS